jgi:hypothetical protein
MRPVPGDLFHFVITEARKQKLRSTLQGAPEAIERIMQVRAQGFGPFGPAAGSGVQHLVISIDDTGITWFNVYGVHTLRWADHRTLTEQWIYDVERL